MTTPPDTTWQRRHDALSVADERTFDAWVASDTEQTLAEFAEFEPSPNFPCAIGVAGHLATYTELTMNPKSSAHTVMTCAPWNGNWRGGYGR